MSTELNFLFRISVFAASKALSYCFFCSSPSNRATSSNIRCSNPFTCSFASLRFSASCFASSRNPFMLNAFHCSSNSACNFASGSMFPRSQTACQRGTQTSRSCSINASSNLT
ncbi:hypothetical protein BT63DRAFT_65873 [Microthyrium microscopicum]|uniref:Uncharacterized protein n=1 Tax=Microthyrium microscopicum TaxID=703497 RepID=A0A6A6TZB9_9PEZI|nr:hypothetical protein BT63DRAFT_65873 [Microthyrium microscopicum]